MLRALLVLILLILIARSFWRVIDGVIEAAGGTTARPGKRRASPMTLSRDPVCGTFVQPGHARTALAKGKTYYFCSDRCRDVFMQG